MPVAVVTGGATGIGFAVARRLTERGWQCILLGRREERLREAADELEAEYEVCDVGDRAAVERVAARVRERHPAIGLLVNNAGIPGRGGGFLDLPPERIEELIRTNYLGSVWCLLAFLPALEAGSPAHLVNVASVAGTVALGPYSSSKHAQLAFSRWVGAELRPRGIRVHTVVPGWVYTEGFPHETLRRTVVRHTIVRPERLADRIVRAVERDRAEIFVPAWTRIAAWAQAAAPSALARLLGRRRRLGSRR